MPSLDGGDVAVERIAARLEKLRDDVQEIVLTLARLREKVSAFEVLTDAKIATIAKALDSLLVKTVTLDQFWPVKTIVYGTVGAALLSVLSALLFLVLQRGSP
jgi:hypothetical protein